MAWASVTVKRGHTSFHVAFDENGVLSSIHPYAVIGKPAKGRRSVSPGGGWHIADQRPIPKVFKEIAEEAQTLFTERA